MLKRREFAMAGLAAALFGPVPGRARTGQSAIVVGAGAAGITAGYLLRRAGVRVTLLEAAPRWGGRMQRLTGFADFPIDLGAEWIHADPSVLAEIVDDKTRRVEVDTIRYRPRTYDTWQDGARGSANWLRLAYAEYKFKHTTWFGFFERYLLPSVQSDLQLNQVVRQISHAGPQVEVSTASTTLQADHVIVTVPFSVLQRRGISFTPALPQGTRQALQDTIFGSGLKVFLRFKERFYADLILPDGLDAFMADSWSDRVYYDAGFGKGSDHNVLGLFHNSNEPLALTRRSEAEIQATLLAELDRIYDGAASQVFEKAHVQNWDKMPFIHGTYANDYLGDDGDDPLPAFGAAQGRLLFAGEALGGADRSTVQGAAWSAYAAVEQLLQG